MWHELNDPTVKVDAYRRNLQHAYLDLVNNKVNGTTTVPVGLPPEFAGLFATSPDEKPFYRAELRILNTSVTGALGKTSDRETRAHLEGVRNQIAKILDPKFVQGAGGAGNVIRIGIDGLDRFSAPPDQIGTCWPDYVIRPY